MTNSEVEKNQYLKLKTLLKYLKTIEKREQSSLGSRLKSYPELIVDVDRYKRKNEYPSNM